MSNVLPKFTNISTVNEVTVPLPGSVANNFEFGVLKCKYLSVKPGYKRGDKPLALEVLVLSPCPGSAL